MNALRCDKCSGVFCTEGKVDKDLLPDFCPMKTMEDIIQTAGEKYAHDDVKSIYVPATLAEKEAYEVVRGKIIPFRHNKGTGRVAFCTRLSDEASRD